MDKGTTGRAIAILEKEGYVERKVFSVDKRIKKLYLTENLTTLHKNDSYSKISYSHTLYYYNFLNKIS